MSMNSKLLPSGFVLVLLFAAPAACRGDVLDASDATHFGKLAAIDASGAQFNVGCNANQRISIPLAKFRSIDFDDSCNPRNLPVRSPATAQCSVPMVTLFVISFTNDQSAWASSVSGDQSQLTLQIYNSGRRISGPTTGLRSMYHGAVCPDYIRQSAWPSSFK
jgi:hypothetical protein